MTVPQANQTDSLHAHLVREVLEPKFPLYDIAKAVSVLNEEANQHYVELQARRDAEHARLSALSLDELKSLKEQQVKRMAAAATVRADREKRLQSEAAAKEAKREAAKFYNQSSATADFQHWSKMDHWTFDEALALLLGKDPRVLTHAAMKNELAAGWGLIYNESQRKKAGFLREYENLRHVAERATAMRGPQLRPEQVLLWAHQSGAISPPAALVRAVVVRIERNAVQRVQTPPTPPAVLPAQNESQLVPAINATQNLKRAALVKTYIRLWPSIEGDLRHANENGLREIAKAPVHGYWLEDKALLWARQNGKLSDTATSSTNNAHAPFGRVHRTGD